MDFTFKDLLNYMQKTEVVPYQLQFIAYKPKEKCKWWYYMQIFPDKASASIGMHNDEDLKSIPIMMITFNTVNNDGIITPVDVSIDRLYGDASQYPKFDHITTNVYMKHVFTSEEWEAISIGIERLIISKSDMITRYDMDRLSSDINKEITNTRTKMKYLIDLLIGIGESIGESCVVLTKSFDNHITLSDDNQEGSSDYNNALQRAYNFHLMNIKGIENNAKGNRSFFDLYGYFAKLKYNNAEFEDISKCMYPLQIMQRPSMDRNYRWKNRSKGIFYAEIQYGYKNETMLVYLYETDPVEYVPKKIGCFMFETNPANDGYVMSVRLIPVDENGKCDPMLNSKLIPINTRIYESNEKDHWYDIFGDKGFLIRNIFIDLII